jgi:preprotein translocase subunit Sss1
MENNMKLSTPKNVTFYIAVGLALIGFIGYFIASFSAFAPWLVLIGFIVLALGNVLEGM